jgi:hypothetical protein
MAYMSFYKTTLRHQLWYIVYVGAKTKIQKELVCHFRTFLFEGTENIKRGEWFKIVTEMEGTNNANTSDDRTYYYEVFPSNNLELGLWMEEECYILW